MDLEKEKNLIAAAKKDPKAFGELFEEYYPKILKYTIYRTGNAAVGSDITSETFFKALKNLWQYKWTGVPFGSWLYRIAGNEIQMYWRHLKYEPSSLDSALEDNPNLNTSSKQDLDAEVKQAQETLDNDSEYARVKNALLKLPRLYQEALLLRFFEEMKISEIAKTLGKKEGTVKSLISRGLSMLKAGVQPNDASRITWSESKIESEAK